MPFLVLTKSSAVASKHYMATFAVGPTPTIIIITLRFLPCVCVCMCVWVTEVGHSWDGTKLVMCNFLIYHTCILYCVCVITHRCNQGAAANAIGKCVAAEADAIVEQQLRWMQSGSSWVWPQKTSDSQNTTARGCWCVVVQRSDLCNMRELPGAGMITPANEGAVAKASEATCKFSIFWGPCPKNPPFPSSNAILHNTHSWVLLNPISWLWPYKGSGIKVYIKFYRVGNDLKTIVVLNSKCENWTLGWELRRSWPAKAEQSIMSLSKPGFKPT